MRLRLKDSGLSVGRIVPTTTPGAIGWLSEGFEQPFLFDARAVRSISSIDDHGNSSPASGQCFELSNGGMLCGEIQGLDEQWLVVDSPLLGMLRVERSRVVSMFDSGYAGDLIYSGPRDDHTWRPGPQVGDQPNWEFEAGTLVAKRQGAAIVGSVKLPKKAQVHFVLTWKGAPDFVFSFGVDPTQQANAVKQVAAAARLEVWDKQLALLREVDTSADIELLAELSPTNPRLELTIYIDQEAGLIVVCDSHGKPLDRMVLPAEKPKFESGVQLINHGTSLTLERFEVREWDGITTVGGTGSGIVLNDANELLSGSIVGYDPTTSSFQVETEAGPQMIPLSNVRRGDFGIPPPPEHRSQPLTRPVPPPVAQPLALGSKNAAAANEAGGSDPGRSPNDTTSSKGAKPAGDDSLTAVAGLFEPFDQPATPPISPDAPIELELVFKDRTRLTGKWLPANSNALRFQPQGFESPISFAVADLIGLVGDDDRFAIDLTKQKNGTLKLKDTLLAGFLEENTPASFNSALAWRPHGSVISAPISPKANGAIIYRASLPKSKRTMADDPGPRQDAIAGPVVQMFLGGRTSAKPNNAAASGRPSTTDERELSFRSGDAIKGIVKEMDESGVRFESEETVTTFARHEQMQSVWLNRKRREYEIAPEKLERLMTVPRAMKFDPPTHLLVSIMGDYLRGRLISADEKSVAVEIRSEIVQLPREQIAQIIWLHDRNWSNENSTNSNAGNAEAAAIDSTVAGDSASNKERQAQADRSSSDDQFQVHVIRGNDRGLTFVPETIQAGVMRGTSDLLGQCAVELSELNQVLFGRNISQQVRAYHEDPWTLSLAQYPAVYNADGGPSTEVGANSPLVGQPAPEFGLKTLSGDLFRLKDSHDRVLVLDFWASWCGPCVQTMPLVEEAVKEIGEDKVHLVAINIQETPERVKAAVERLKLDATVVLDRDGEVAAAYNANAIPQTVIIDKDGKVTHVFVGGGVKIVDAIRAALK
jgi:thiol-disulfide isomerase/thioredoxin